MLNFCINYNSKSFYNHFFTDSSWEAMPRDVKVPHKFFEKGFQVKVKGEGVYYYLYDSQDTKITIVAFNLVTKKFYLDYCLEG